MSLSLKGKLLSAFLGLSTISVIIGGTTWMANKKVIANYNVIANQNLPKVAALGGIRYAAQEVNRAVLRSTMVSTPEDVKRIQSRFDAALEEYNQYVHKYEEIENLAGEAVIYEKAKVAWVDYLNHSNTAMKNSGKAELVKETSDLIEGPLTQARFRQVDALVELLKFHDDAAHAEKAAAETAASNNQFILWSLVAIGFCVSAVMGFLMSNSLARSLNLISEEIASSADHTAAAGSQLSAASQQLSEGSSEAAASLEETVASLEELTSMVKLNADHAKEANALSQRSRQSAATGESEIKNLIVAMEEIAGSSRKIEEIINVIDDIAFQTNLLALNAAVEAARAGEQGKGFAVVAEAVRALAQRSAVAAKDINSLIQRNVEQTESGSKIASRSGEVLQEIVTSVIRVSDLNNEISVASQEQSAGLEQISKAMNQLDQATQGNAASSEEVAASSQEMSGQALNLARLVARLRAVVSGKEMDAAALAEEKKTKSAKKKPKVTTAVAPKKGNVLSFTKAEPRKKVVSQAVEPTAEDILPLDGDSGRGKVGNVSGF